MGDPRVTFPLPITAGTDRTRYYCCTNQESPSPTATIVDEISYSNDAPTGDEQPSAGHLSNDITLTALAQLGVHRLACNRSFVSLIDGDNQHIIAEATASISLRRNEKHLPDDGLYLGVRALDLVWGVCPHTIRLFTGQDTSYEVDTENVTANRTRYIIRDFTREDCFKDRPYVLEWPHMRFYAEVPLISPSGYVLGSYCVVDDRPRESFPEEDVEILQEISDAIANHLENMRITHYHSRFERLVKGLTDFSKDQHDFDPRNSSENRMESAKLTLHKTRPPLVVVDAKNPLDDSSIDRNESGGGSDSQSSSTIRTDQPSPLSFPGKQFGSTEPSSLVSNLSLGQTSPVEETTFESLDEAMMLANNRPEKRESFESLSDSVITSDGIQGLFSRASVLLRDAMNLDGVVFLDGTRSNPSLSVTLRLVLTSSNNMAVYPPRTRHGSLFQKERPRLIIQPHSRSHFFQIDRHSLKRSAKSWAKPSTAQKTRHCGHRAKKSRRVCSIHCLNAVRKVKLSILISRM